MIVRAARPAAHFTVLRNEVVRDARLSWKARGLLAYLLSMPDDWRTNSETLAREAPDGRDSVRSGLAELERAGYLVRRKARDPETGQIRTESVLYDDPVEVAEAPGTGLPAPVDPAVGSSDAGECGALRRTETKDLEEEKPPATSPEVASLVELLSARVAEHQGHAPKTKAWARAIDLLMRRGATEWAEPAPVPADEIAAMIGFVFDECSTPRNGFCWADQVRSGEALRRHWTKLVAERRRRGASGSNVVDDVMDAYDRAGATPGDLFDHLGGDR